MSTEASQKATLLLQSCRVMTLGTACAEVPWTAPVYYIFRRRGCYFFSNPESRHIRDGEGRLSSAAIFRDRDRFDMLEGIQMTGRIRTCTPSAESVKAALSYAKNFKIPVDPGRILTDFVRLFHASLYRFEPEELLYMDNSTGFGHREQVTL